MNIVIPTNHRLALYGLSAPDFVRLWEAQGGRCYICERTFTRQRPACIDHCHKTYTVRGLLCGNCNQQLGWLHDDFHWLSRAAEYLNVPPADTLFDTPRRTKDAPPIPQETA